MGISGTFWPVTHVKVIGHDLDFTSKTSAISRGMTLVSEPVLVLLS